MAKSKKSLADIVEDAIRKAINGVPELKKCGEIDYCEAVLEALDAIKVGVETRRDELDHEEVD